MHAWFLSSGSGSNNRYFKCVAWIKQKHNQDQCWVKLKINKTNIFIFVCFLDLELSRADIEKAVIAAKASVDSSYLYSRREWVYKPAELLNTSFGD